MPIHIHPFFRSLEIKVLEPSGIYKTLDSAGYTDLRAAEVAGTAVTPPASLNKTVIYQGSSTALTLP